MIIKRNSKWGLKRSTNDITNDIMGIINNANQFIVIGGYNFTFQNAGARPFFDALVTQVNNGIPVLMIIPPTLGAQGNLQPQIINYCMRNNIGVILNGNNHSKWALTDNDLYYGSSNFTHTSWTSRVEVVSIHKHSRIRRPWANETVNDFEEFISDEIAAITIGRRRTMRNYAGLTTSTIQIWNNILPLIQRLNPSIEKVIVTLSNYEEVKRLLSGIIQDWFDLYDEKYFELIYKFCNDIFIRVNNVCEFAYANIYNEAIEKNQDVSDEIALEYNNLHSEFTKIVQANIATISNTNFINSNSRSRNVESTSQIFNKNLQAISAFNEFIKGSNNNSDQPVK